jgi:hypothetical protein
MSIPDRTDVLNQLAAEGFWDSRRTADVRYCALFTRLAAYRMNPTGDRSSFGWLSKSGGEAGYDGTAVDAIVYGDSPSSLDNVVDLIGGAEAPGGSLAWQAGRPRRPSNTWVRPVALSDADMAFLKGQATGGGGTGGGGTTGGGSTVTCRYQPPDLAGLLNELTATYALVAAMQDEQAAQRVLLEALHQQNQQLLNIVNDFDARFRAGFAIDASAGWVGKIRGTVKG